MRAGDQLGAVAGIDRTSVEAGNAAPEDLLGDGDDLGLPRVGIVGGRRDAVLADGPDRLVGEPDLRRLLVVRELGERKIYISHMWRFTTIWPYNVTGGRRKWTFAFHFDIVSLIPFLMKRAFLGHRS